MAEAEPFERLFLERRQAVFALCFRALGDAQEAEEAVMQTFLKAFKAYPGFRGDSSPGTWLHRIALNTLNDHIRWKVRRRRWLGPLLSLEARLTADDGEASPRSESIPDPSPATDSRLEAEELRRTVREAVQELPESFREAMWLVHFEGLSYEETARVLGTTAGNVGVRLSRAKRLLEKRLAGVPEGVLAPTPAL